MTAPDYARLRELASAAMAEHDARYLADCDPQTILALLDERDAAREALPPGLLAANGGNVHEAIAHLSRGFSTERTTLDGLLDERDALAAVVEAVRAVVDQALSYSAAYDLAGDIEALLPKEAP